MTNFDASIGGLGGCPFAPGASGNVCTEDLVHCLHAMGVATGIDLDRLIGVSRRVEQIVGRALPGQIDQGRALDATLPGARHRRRSTARMTKKAQRMLAVMDRANALWNIPNIGRAKGRVIRRLIDRHRPTRAIEVGSLLGYSAILIAGALPPSGKLICLEANDYLAKFVKSNAEEAGLGRRVRVIVGDALRVIPLLPGRFDFALLDARKEDYLDYLRQLEPKLGARRGGGGRQHRRVPQGRGRVSRVRARSGRALAVTRVRLRRRHDGSQRAARAGLSDGAGGISSTPAVIWRRRSTA